MKNLTEITFHVTEKTVDCPSLRIMGIYCIFVTFISIFSNTLLISVLIKHKELLKRENILVLVLAILNLIGTLVSMPLVTISAFQCK